MTSQEALKNYIKINWLDGVTNDLRTPLNFENELEVLNKGKERDCLLRVAFLQVSKVAISLPVVISKIRETWMLHINVYTSHNAGDTKSYEYLNLLDQIFQNKLIKQDGFEFLFEMSSLDAPYEDMIQQGQKWCNPWKCMYSFYA